MFTYSDWRTPKLYNVIPSSQDPGSYISFRMTPKQYDVEDINDFQLIDSDGINFVCDRFDLHYNLLFPNYNNGIYHAMCRISPDIPAGYYDV